ncbi:hypothetical protein CORC01_12198 [Colletotrichum orchidophilum]|uniref:Uncharacterized protein n=1 Tax=Colletotrichum orchidophilum TaxID=1209926 RepID=A0A1G4ATI6_9PEZI|nr:uncharacterized protein CORC01_12198 [Colletotrichum orchidophilum]OHE92480.1 hypothetical protein CORC01_12198 [Colletotrichum orchidophilum]
MMTMTSVHTLSVLKTAKSGHESPRREHSEYQDEYNDGNSQACRYEEGQGCYQSESPREYSSKRLPSYEHQPLEAIITQAGLQHGAYENVVEFTTNFLDRAVELTRLPRIPGEFDTITTWYFTRCKTHNDAINLLRIEGWQEQRKLGRNILFDFELRPKKVAKERAAWFKEHVWIWGLVPGAALGNDVPVFKFSDEDLRFLGKYVWPVEWELEDARLFARRQASAESKGFLGMFGRKTNELELMAHERCLLRENWRELYASWEWRQKIANMWWGSSADQTAWRSWMVGERR